MPRLVRYLLLTLVTSLFALVGEPAHATVSVTIAASPASPTFGTTTTISGKAVNAKPGSIVKLQRRAGGVWLNVASKRVWSARTYAFKPTPPKGVQYYRVVKPRQLHQRYALSPVVKLTVRWRPTVTVRGTNGYDVGTGDRWYDVVGKVQGVPPGTVLRRQHLAWNNEWVTQNAAASLTTAKDGSFRARLRLLDNRQFRYLVAGVGPRQAAYSATLRVAHLDAVAPMNSSVRITSVKSGGDHQIGFDAKAGEEITVAFTELTNADSIELLLREADGDVVFWRDLRFSTLERFVAPAAGRYHLAFGHVEPTGQGGAGVTVSISRTLEMPASLGGSAPVQSKVPGQIVQGRFDGKQGQVVSARSSALHCDCPVSLLLGEQEIPQLAGSFDSLLTWQLPSDGSYHLRYAPFHPVIASGTLALQIGKLLKPTVNEAVASASLEVDDAVAVFDVDAKAGQELTVARRASTGLKPEDIRVRYLRPDGEPLNYGRQTPQGFELTVPADGTYRVVVALTPGVTGSVSYAASTPLVVPVTIGGPLAHYDLGEIHDRKLQLTFPAAADQRFAPRAQHSDGSPCRLDGVARNGDQWEVPGDRFVHQAWTDGDYDWTFRPCQPSGTIGLGPVDPESRIYAGGASTTLRVANDVPSIAALDTDRYGNLQLDISDPQLSEGARCWAVVAGTRVGGNVGYRYLDCTAGISAQLHQDETRIKYRVYLWVEAGFETSVQLGVKYVA